MPELSLVFKATVVLTAALAASYGARRARAAVRALILACGFAAVLVLPLAGLVVPARTVRIPVTPPPQAAGFVEDVSSTFSRAIGGTTALSRSAAERKSYARPTGAAALRVVWVVGAVITLIPLLAGLWRLRRLARDGRPWPEGRTLIDEVCGDEWRHRPVHVFVHDELTAPMTCGVWRPAIGLPADVVRWTQPEIRRALVHELEHVRRRDWWLQLTARLACALYWFHPLAWAAWRRLHVETERACDDTVLRTADAAAYAEQLVSLARRVSGRYPAPVLFMASRSELGARVTAILDGHSARGRASTACTSAVVALAAALALAISPLQAVRFAAPVLEAQAAQPRPPAFEVASIRRNTSATVNQTITRAGNTFVARNVTLRDLVSEAYRIKPDQLSGADGWIASERYDVEARPEGVAAWDEQMIMLQTLLADRFRLRIRHEPRQVPAYALVPGRGSVKLRPAAEGECPVQQDPCGTFRTRPGEVIGRRVTVSRLAGILSGRSGRPVVDASGIGGTHDFELKWTPDASQLPPGPAPDDLPPFDPSGPSLFTAIEEQLGLRLQPTTAAVDHFVIEHAQRPSPNDVATSSLRP